MRKTILFIFVSAFISLAEFSIAIEFKPNGQNKNLPIVGYIGAPDSIYYWKKLRSSLFSRAKELGVVAVDFTGDNYTPNAQRLIIERAAEMKIDGMIVGVVSEEISSSIEYFRKRNIPVLVLNSGISSHWHMATIATNNLKAAEMAGSFILESLKFWGGDGRRVVILCGDRENEVARIRASVPYRILSNAGYDVHVYYSNGWHPKFSVGDAIKEFSSHGQQIAAVFSCYADASIASVLTAEHFGHRPLLVGFDFDDNIRTMIKSGRLDAAVIQNPVKIGEVGIEEMYNVLKGKNLPHRTIDIPARLVTRENVQDY